ncbi:MAG: ABC transporter ATP-binding protein [Candidatus Wallbacteria bacterium]|nr:ABC transporter ATP-binding protein [Candidatus Wallbacteria bacterium]
MLQVSDLSFAGILSGISFQAGPGEIVGIVGENGAGKTTLLKAILFHNKETGGSISICGREIDTLSRRVIARHFAYIPQSFSVDFDVRVQDFLYHSRYAYDENRNSSARKIEEAAELCSVTGFLEKNLRLLSGGERQRVMLCSAVVQNAPVWLCDEPTSNLDPKAEADFFNLLEKIRKERQLTALLVSHNLQQIVRHSDKILALRNGRVLYYEPASFFTAEIFSNIYNARFTMLEHGGRKHIVTGDA